MRKRFLLYILLIPVFAVAGGLIFYNMAPVFSGANSTVRLARDIRFEKESGIESLSKSVLAFKEAGQTEAELFIEEEFIIKRFRKASPWAGILLGISLGIGLVSLTITTRRTEYKPDQGKCFSCGRCFKYCPIKVKSYNEA
jgi:ferredoxin